MTLVAAGDLLKRNMKDLIANTLRSWGTQAWKSFYSHMYHTPSCQTCQHPIFHNRQFT